jgi:chromosome segregation ATPase
MVEQIMYIGIGFLIAGLLVIGVIPLVHARAVRLTMRRLEALTPLSIAEIQADKDQLRAEFAMTMSRLEMSVEQMKAKTTNQLAELGRKTEAIGRLKLELGEKTAALFALEAKEKQLSDDLQTTQTELAAKAGALEEAERALTSARTELVQVTASFNDASVAAGGQRVELVALRAQTEALKGQIDSYEKETKALWDHLNSKTAELEAASQQLAEERGRADNLANRVGELDRQLVAQTAESEVLGGRVQELAARLDEEDRLVAERESASEDFRNAATTAQKIEAEIRAQLAEMEDRHRLALATIKTEKSLIETELKRSQDERDKLQREMAAVKRDAENAGSYERMENAVLRERIDEVAAEVAQLTATLEGPDSPIETILNAGRPAAPAGNGPLPAVPAARVGESKGTLADRIRTLQARASRGAPAQRGPKRGAAPRGARAEK